MELVTQTYLDEQAEAIRFELGQATQNIVSAGQRLVEVQERTEHGKFLVWVEAEFGMSKSQAYNLINIGKNFPILPNFGSFSKSALYALAAPSVPEAARQEAVQKASFGKQITHKEAKQIVAKHKEPAKPKPEPVVAAPTEPPKQPVGAPTKLPTFAEVWASLPAFHQKRLDSYPGVKHSAEAIVNATIALVASLNP